MIESKQRDVCKKRILKEFGAVEFRPGVLITMLVSPKYHKLLRRESGLNFTRNVRSALSMSVLYLWRSRLGFVDNEQLFGEDERTAQSAPI